MIASFTSLLLITEFSAVLGAVDGARPLPASLEVLIKVDDPAVDGRSDTIAVESDS